MSVMEIICWMQTAPPVCHLCQGLVMLPPPSPANTHTHTPPHHPQPLVSPLLFPTVSHLLHRALFCFTYTVALSVSPPFFLSLQLFCHSNTLTLKASYDCLVSTALCLSPLPDVASFGTELVVVRVLCDDYIDLHLWPISCFTVTVVQH